MKSKALELDQQDPLYIYRDEFHFPKMANGDDYIYLCGNSLGLQPKRTQEAILQELKDWAMLGVEGHFEAKNPWLPYHETVTHSLAHLVGAKPEEVVAMNSLTVNLHILMASFYRPTKQRYKILIEGNAFPSDQYAVASQARFHSKTVGFDSSTAILEVFPRAGESIIRTEDILQTIEDNKDSLALVMLGGVNYLTGQLFEIEKIGQKTHEVGAIYGLDLAHAAGNIDLKLHTWNVDFAAWCSYKYLNAGPGGISGIYIHQRHFTDPSIPRFEGWWGHDKKTRFVMPSQFSPIPSAEAWQLSNPPIFQLAALKASLDVFDRADIINIRAKTKKMSTFLWELLAQLPQGFVEIFTPEDPEQRGAQLSLKIKNSSREMVKDLRDAGIICDFREPNIIRVAPTGLYNSYMDCYRFVERLELYAKK
ncbi:MAG: kynureninase [Bdellovibrionales bacterium]|nr:kynureninase [Bdellovibrionales bacterium]